MAEQDVVVDRQETRWRRDLGARQQPMRDVEQLRATLGAERSESRSQPLHRLAQAGQAGPGLDVRDASRPERLEVALDHPVGGWVRVERSAEPVLGGCESRLAAPTPDSPWRDLDERRERPDRVPESDRVAVRPPLA